MKDRSALVLGFGLFLTTMHPAQAVFIRDDVPVSSYNSLALQPAYAAAGYLKFYNVTGSSYTVGTCSGTLISPTKVLTAAHCFTTADGVVSPATSRSFGTTAAVPAFDASATANIASFVNSLLYTSGPTKGLATNDVSIVTLTTAIADIKPAAIYLGEDVQGKTATIIGYGGQGSGTVPGPKGLQGANDRLGGTNVLDVANSNVIQIDFDSPAGDKNTYGSATPLSLEASVAGGDSGGPLFIDVSGQKQFRGR